MLSQLDSVPRPTTSPRTLIRLKDVLRRNVIQFANQSEGRPDLSLAIAGG